MNRSPASIDPIRIKNAIATDDRNLLRQRLRDHQPIKRITMMKRQRCDQIEVIKRRHKQPDPVVIEHSPHTLSDWSLALQSPHADLNRHLPNRGNAQHALGIAPLDQPTRAARQTRVTLNVPEKRMRIDLDLHQRFASQSGSGSSKLSAIRNSPFPLPHSGVPASPVATTNHTARSFPSSSAINTSSPRMAASNNSPNLTFASSSVVRI